MTPKQKVLEKWPGAFISHCLSWPKSANFRVIGSLGRTFSDTLGEGDTEEAAWADAAKRLGK